MKTRNRLTVIAASSAILASPTIAEATTLDPLVHARAKLLASQYASLRGYDPNACATTPVTVEIRPKLEVGGSPVWGMAYIGGQCLFAISSQAIAAGMQCEVELHELLHLWRDDEWHSSDPTSPLYHYTMLYSPCHPGLKLTLTLGQAKGVIKSRLPRWRTVVTGWSSQRGLGITQVEVVARHRQYKARKFHVRRSITTGQLVVTK